MASDVPYRKLRVLLVDDNRINLSVLSTLLKRRFGPMVEGTPVSVDSGLKAIQLLRTNVFDCIMMDIQMPFLSGLDTSIRIRNGEDGVLEANRSVHIVAVTTAVGDEPELAYRRAGMDGMIGKPVRFQDMEHYICPLAHEAFNAANSVNTISINGDSIMPPLPPTISRSERLFYLPANATIRAPCPDICRGADFEKMLRAQTRASLRKSGAIAVARTGTWSPSSSRRRQLEKTEDDHISEEDIIKSSSQSTISTETTESDHVGEPPSSPLGARGRVLDLSQVRPKHSRNASLTISKRTLSQQIQREMDNLEGQSDLSDSGAAKVTIERPRALHRTSSPAWLVTQGLNHDAGDQFVTSPTSPSSPYRLATRPNWLLSMKAGSPLNASRNSSSNSNGSSTLSTSKGSSDGDEYETPLLTPDADNWFFRRDSQRSNGSVTSDTSTDLPTPANEFPVWPAPSSYDAKALNRLSNDSSSTIDPCSDDSYVAPSNMAIAATKKDITSSSQGYGSHITATGVLAHDLQDAHLN